jgi:hypothetical protein
MNPRSSPGTGASPVPVSLNQCIDLEIYMQRAGSAKVTASAKDLFKSMGKGSIY